VVHYLERSVLLVEPVFRDIRAALFLPCSSSSSGSSAIRVIGGALGASSGLGVLGGSSGGSSSCCSGRVTTVGGASSRHTLLVCSGGALMTGGIGSGVVVIVVSDIGVGRVGIGRGYGSSVSSGGVLALVAHHAVISVAEASRLSNGSAISGSGGSMRSVSGCGTCRVYLASVLLHSTSSGTNSSGSSRGQTKDNPTTTSTANTTGSTTRVRSIVCVHCRVIVSRVGRAVMVSAR